MGKLCLRKLPPFFFLLNLSIVKRTVIVCNEIVLVFAFSLLLAFANDLF